MKEKSAIKPYLTRLSLLGVCSQKEPEETPNCGKHWLRSAVNATWYVRNVDLKYTTAIERIEQNQVKIFQKAKNSNCGK